MFLESLKLKIMCNKRKIKGNTEFKKGDYSNLEQKIGGLDYPAIIVLTLRLNFLIKTMCMPFSYLI